MSDQKFDIFGWAVEWPDQEGEISLIPNLSRHHRDLAEARRQQGAKVTALTGDLALADTLSKDQIEALGDRIATRPPFSNTWTFTQRDLWALAESIQQTVSANSYRRGFQDGYNRRDGEVKGALA